MNRALACLAPILLLLLQAGCDASHGELASMTDASAALAAAASEMPNKNTPAEPADGEPTPNAPQESAQELDWDALIPPDWRPEEIMAEYDADNLSDDDPRAQELMNKLKALWKESPVVPELEGKLIKLPGFIVPLEMGTETIAEFLLVPYYGACIHVPPPPANQTVHVTTKKGHEYRGRLFDTVWVTGTIHVEPLSSELAEAGYRMNGASVEPYE